MAYQIDKFNGNFLVSIDDQTINTTATSLKLVGRNYAGYGEIQNESFVHMLENFASTTAPPRSLEGQIWYDSSEKKLKYYNGQRYKSASGAEVSSFAPSGMSPGEFWFDNQAEQLYTWSGSEFVLVGPERTPTQGDTSVEPKVVKDELENNRSILQFIVGNKIIGIFSKEQFILNSIINPIEGFFTIRPGLNLVDIDSNGIQTTSSYRIWGTSTNSQRLNGLSSDDFLRSANTEFRTQVKFLDNGFVVGDQNDLRIRVINGNEPVIENTIGGKIILRVVAGVNPRDIAIIQEDGIVPGNNELYFLGKPGSRWREINSETVRSEIFYGKLIGTIESPAPGTPGGPPLGQPIPPLTLQSGLSVAGSFSMSSPAPGSEPSNFEINLEGSTGSISLLSGSIGSIDNFNIGSSNPGSGFFTNLNSSGILSVSNIQQSISTTTGSLRVAGGVGISGNLYVGGNTNFVGTGTLTIPVGSTAQRPNSPVIGMIRFNTDIENFEGYDGEKWRIIGEETSDDYGDLSGVVTVTLDYRFVNEVVDTSLDYGNLF
jgi:hypothetical protein